MPEYISKGRYIQMATTDRSDRRTPGTALFQRSASKPSCLAHARPSDSIWCHRRLHWGSLHFAAFRVTTEAGRHLFEVEILLNDLEADEVRVELYADGRDGGDAERQELKWARALPGGSRRRVSRDGYRHSLGRGIYRAGYATAGGRGRATGVQASPVATLMSAPQCDFNQHLSGVFEPADVRVGSALPLGTRRKEDSHWANIWTGLSSIRRARSGALNFSVSCSRNQHLTPPMIEIIASIRGRHGLRVAVLSNEGRELNAYRIRTFKPNDIVDFFVCSTARYAIGAVWKKCRRWDTRRFAHDS